MPYSSLESVIEHSKEGYYVALRKTQGTIRTDVPNWQPWVLFFLRALQQQMKRLAEKIERERIVLSAIPELSVQIVEYAREHGRVTIGDMVANRHYPEQAQVAPPPPAGKGAPGHARQRSWLLVCIGIGRRSPGVLAASAGRRLRPTRTRTRRRNQEGGLRLTRSFGFLKPQVHEPFQGSTTSRPQSSKSATLRVASFAPRTWAMAAICASAWLIGLPSARR